MVNLKQIKIVIKQIMINTPKILKTSDDERQHNDNLLLNFQLAFCARELDIVMGLLHPYGLFWAMDKDSATPIVYQMMFAEKKGARNLFNIKHEFSISADHKPGQPVLKLTIHNKAKPPFDDASLSQPDVKKVNFDFAFDFKDGLIYQVRSAGITKSKSQMNYLERNN
jgi:hypothetical protein